MKLPYSIKTFVIVNESGAVQQVIAPIISGVKMKDAEDLGSIATFDTKEGIELFLRLYSHDEKYTIQKVELQINPLTDK
jgi:hypothetical protein